MYFLFRFDLSYLLNYPIPNQQGATINVSFGDTDLYRNGVGARGPFLYPRESFSILAPPLHHPSNKEDNNDHCVLQFFIQRSCAFWLHHLNLSLLDRSLSYYFLFRVICQLNATGSR